MSSNDSFDYRKYIFVHGHSSYKEILKTPLNNSYYKFFQLCESLGLDFTTAVISFVHNRVRNSMEIITGIEGCKFELKNNHILASIRVCRGLRERINRVIDWSKAKRILTHIELDFDEVDEKQFYGFSLSEYLNLDDFRKILDSEKNTSFVVIENLFPSYLELETDSDRARTEFIRYKENNNSQRAQPTMLNYVSSLLHKFQEQRLYGMQEVIMEFISWYHSICRFSSNNYYILNWIYDKYRGKNIADILAEINKTISRQDEFIEVLNEPIQKIILDYLLDGY